MCNIFNETRPVNLRNIYTSHTYLQALKYKHSRVSEINLKLIFQGKMRQIKQSQDNVKQVSDCQHAYKRQTNKTTWTKTSRTKCIKTNVNRFGLPCHTDCVGLNDDLIVNKPSTNQSNQFLNEPLTEVTHVQIK